MKLKPTPGLPFPPVNEPQFRARIAEALLATEDVTLTAEAASALAALVTDRAADLVTKRDKAGIVTIRPERLRRHDVGDGNWVLELECHPTWNCPWWHNLRVEHRWADPAAPIRPWPTPLTSGTGAATAALTTHFDTLEDAQAVLRWGNTTLRNENSDVSRGYSLVADLARNGQEQAGAAVMHAVVWADDNGQEHVKYVLANVLGNSRAMWRLDLLGASWEEAIFGVHLGTFRAARPGKEYSNEKTADGVHIIVPDPAEAWNRLMAAYEAVSDAVQAEEPVPDGYEAVEANIDLEAAARLAHAPCWVIVGVSDPERTLDLVQRRNLRDHLRGNQDLQSEARHLAMGAEVINAYAAHGRIAREQAPALAGAIPPDALAPNKSRHEAEAIRRSRLVPLLFPTDDGDRRIVSAALGEPSRKTDLRSTDTDLRSRVLTALVSRGQLNSRVGELFTLVDTKDGTPVCGSSVTELVAAAQKDPASSAATELLRFHAVVLLGEAGLYEADRGSSVDRREPTNVKNALLRARSRAVGLVAELLEAQRRGSAPHEVDDNGEAIPATLATKDWFNMVFPKKSYNAAEPLPPATAPPATPEQQLHDAEVQAVAAIAEDVNTAVETVRACVDLILSLCLTHGMPLDDDWVKEFNRECAASRNALIDANNADALVRASR